VPKDQTNAWWQALKAENPNSHLISTYGLSAESAAA
jgi:hypothetical protein